MQVYPGFTRSWLSRRSHRRCARIRCAPPVARNATTALMPPAKKPSSYYAVYISEVGCKKVAAANEQRGVRLLRRWQVHAGGEVYGYGVPAADRQGAQQLEVPVLAAHREGDHRALHAEARQRLRPLGCTVLHLAGPIELRRCRFGCAILGLGRPVDHSPPATPPTHPPPTRSVAPTCRCSSAPVFWRTRHMLHAWV